MIKRIGERPFVVDREKLSLLTAKGVTGRALEKKAFEAAEGLIELLRA